MNARRIFASPLSLGVLWLVLPASLLNAQSCRTVEPTPLWGLTVYSRGGTGTLIGQDEFVSPSTPPRKYRKLSVSGTVFLGEYDNADASEPTSIAGTATATQGGNSVVYTWSASHLPGTYDTKFEVTGRSDSGPDAVDWRLQLGEQISYLSGTNWGYWEIGQGKTIVGSGGRNGEFFVRAVKWFDGAGEITGPWRLQSLPKQHRDLWNRVRQFDKHSGVATLTDQSARFSSLGGSFPLSSGGSPTSWGGFNAEPDNLAAYGSAMPLSSQTPTQKMYLAASGIVGSGPTFRVSGGVDFSLSDEDREGDAIERARPALGWTTGGVAYRQKRTQGYSFSFRDLEFSVPVDIACAGRYRVIFHIEERPLGESTAVPIKHVVFVEREFPTGRSIVKGSADVARMQLSIEGGASVSLREDREYSVAKAEIASVSCEGAEPGGVAASLRSVHVSLSLGAGPGGRPAGDIVVEADSIEPVLYAPAALRLIQSADTELTVLRDAANALRQIKGPTLFADIATVSPSSYEVRFYASNAAGTPGSDGLYAPSGTAFAVVKFENPEAANPASGKFRVTETRGSRTRVRTYSQGVGAGNAVTWKLEQGDASAVLVTEQLDVTPLSSSLRRERTTLKRGAIIDSVVEREITTFSWGEETTTETLDPDGARPRVTQWAFHAAVSDPGYRRVAQRWSNDGSWEKFRYDYPGRILKVIRPFVNSALNIDDEATHRVTETTYSTIGSAEGDGDSTDEQLTTVIDRTTGQVTGRSFVVAWSKPVTLGGESFNRRTDIVAILPTATWSTTSNLVTETLTYATGPHTGRVRRVLRPDGTATLTSYLLSSAGILTTVTAAGRPNATLDAIVDGTRVTTVTNAQGYVISEASHDLAANLALASWTATAVDALGRPTEMVHHDGIVTTRDYACCGLLSERGRDGVTINYDYDALGRRTEETRGGITVRTDYDAAGRERAQVRLGGPGTADDITLQSWEYDLAGRLYEQRDARSRLTTFVETTAVTGITTRTTTYPDSGTMIETRARDGSSLTVSGTAAAPRSYAYTVLDDLNTTTEIRLGADGATTEWTKTTRDFAGRPSLTVTPLNTSATPATATASQHYNAQGQLERSVDADGVTTLYAYNARGEPSVTAIDLDRDGIIDYNGTDRVTRTTRSVATRTEGADTFTVLRTATEVWDTKNSDAATTIAIAEETPGGLRSWQTVPGPQGIAAPNGLTTATVVTVNPATATTTVETKTPDQAVVTQTYVSGRLKSETVTRVPLGQLRATTNDYDAHGRLWKSTDARNGTTTYTYFDDDQLKTVLSPDPDPERTGPGYDPQLTQFSYDAAGRRSTVTHPDGGETTTTYYLTGQIKRVYGARTYPVEYAYDSQGRMKTLTTWQNFAAETGAAVTKWSYHPATGLLVEKKYAAPAAGQSQATLNYTYTDAGRVETRTGGRGLVTSYYYTTAGDLETLSYSDSTPGVTISYDRRGRSRTVADAAGTRTLDYDASGPLADETYAAGSGALAGLMVDRTFDGFARLGQVAAPSATSVIYGYDLASRLSTVALGTSTATYNYVANSPLTDRTTVDTGGLVRLTTTRTYDNLDRLRSVTHTPNAGGAVSAAYTYNSANQRTGTRRENATVWSYGYDTLGQLESARQTLDGDDATFAGRDFAFDYDDIGNRLTVTRTTAAGARMSTYTPDLLNRYANRSVPGVAEALGGAVPGSMVSLSSPVTGNVIHATDRDGESFRGEVPVDNAAAAQYPELTVTAVKNKVGPLEQDALATITRRALVPKSPEVFEHDADGNLTADGQWRYTWDAENRLIAIETLPALVAPAGPLPAERKRKVEFIYDGQHRRVARKAYSWNTASSTWALTADTRYLYDGWNVIAEFEASPSAPSTFTLTRSYAWGLDLSGTLQDAGGIGGLVFARLHSGATSVTHAAASDGNGNVLAYYNAATGERTARFEYGPFGEPLVDDGPSAEGLTYRFSTKPRDPLTGTYYYGYRHYTPTTGRWLSRDPLQEHGGAHLYRMVSNDPVSRVDVLGLYQEDGHFYVAYAVARANKLSPRDAYGYAYYTQYADEDASFDAIPAWARLRSHLGRDRALDLEIQRTLHSLHGGDANDVRRWRQCLSDMLRTGANLTLWQRGLLTHALGDAFAHTRNNGTAYGPPEGHGGDGTAPDIPQNRPALFREYVETLNNALGGRGSAAELASIVAAATRTPPDGMGEAARHAQARRYVQQRWSYNENYDPAGGRRLDPGLAQLTTEQVRDFLRQISDRCGCEIQNGSTYR